MSQNLKKTGSLTSTQFIGPHSPSVPSVQSSDHLLAWGWEKTQLNLIPGGHPPPQTLPISRPGGLQNGRFVLEIQYKSNILEASRPTNWRGLGGRMPPQELS